MKEKDGDTVSLTVTENAEMSGFALMDGESYDATSNDGIWFPINMLMLTELNLVTV